MSFQDEVTILDSNILRSVREDLQFLIATAKRIFLNSPFGVVQLIIVKLVAPDELHLCRRCVRRPLLSKRRLTKRNRAQDADG